MKIQWSVFFSFLLLFTLVGCGGEEFGTSPQSVKGTSNPLRNFSHFACADKTPIKPKVDILYVVDNSGSSFYISNDIKNGVMNTVNKVSTGFDYRIIGAPLIPDSTPYNDYQVLTNSVDPLPDPSRKIISASELTFFQNPGQQYESEKGLERTINFINNTGTLFRSDAYLIIVLVSNGRDTFVEIDPEGDGNTIQHVKPNTNPPQTYFTDRVNSFNSIKTSKNLTQLRFFAVTAGSACKSDWRRSTHSYVAMANTLPDGRHFDLCTGSVSSIFDQVNETVREQIIPHQYRYTPVTFAENTQNNVSVNDIKVHKISDSGAVTELTRNTDWVYEDRGSVQTVNTRELPTPGEPATGRHFIRFTNLISYPDCVQVTSVSKTEYFGFIVLPQPPVVSSIHVTIRGNVIPQSSTNGWTYRGNITVPNIKKPHTASPGGEIPAIPRTGFMIELHGEANYYKAGEEQVNYIPAGI